MMRIFLEVVDLNKRQTSVDEVFVDVLTQARPASFATQAYGLPCCSEQPVAMRFKLS